MSTISLSVRDLIQSGAHFGHKVSRWNPRMKPFIYGKRNLIHIIDLKKTLYGLVKACKYLSVVAANNGKIIFVATKKQAKSVVEAEAKRANQFYVADRWIGGTLTNFDTIHRSILRLIELETLEADGTFEKYTKKERSHFMREKTKLIKLYEGFRTMSSFPSAMVVVDVKKEKNAVAEAKRLNIPIVALIDTDGDPSQVDFPIPGNDDAMKVIQIVMTKLVDAILEGSSRAKPIQAESEDDKHKGVSYGSRGQFRGGKPAPGKRPYAGGGDLFGMRRPKRSSPGDGGGSSSAPQAPSN